MTVVKRFLSILAFAAMCTTNTLAADRFVAFNKGDLKLCNRGQGITLSLSEGENSAVRIATNSLIDDFMRVCDAKGSITSKTTEGRIVIATVGSTTYAELVKKGEIDEKQIKGKREKFIITTSTDGKQLYIIGSDRRGTVYGIYELSRQMGVSPWYYWMDSPVEKQQAVYVNKGSYTDGEPAVHYRGIFLNDEAPCLTTWVKNTFGTNYGDHKFYEKVFELVLRLKGNFMWPAMWAWAFYADDPLNSKTANDMGVIMGTSHHEPMARNHQEWARKRKQYGAWNYTTNSEVIKQFFREGVERAKDTEDIITIGMRGDGDEAMSAEADTRLLERIVADQRKIIQKVTGKKAKETPQVWALYKEVLDYYDKGMRVPDDVIMLVCDDNWGNVRRVPNAKERAHKGGWGLYYHVDYVGAPRNSKLLNATPTQNMWEQLSLAYDNGIDKMWILNVGDLKPMEYPIQLFLDMAWNPKAPEFTPGTDGVMDELQNHTLNFCKEQFGSAQADEAARILNLIGKYNGRCTAEMLDAKTYNLASGEWQTVVDQYKDLEIAALRQYATLPSEAKDAYFQLILFPTQLMANLHQMYYAQAMNLALAAKGDAKANCWADKCEAFFKRDAELMRQYNKDIAGGKWDGMMTQKHIGYTSWNDDFPKDKLPELKRIADVKNIFEDGGKGYIAMEAEHYFAKTNAEGASWTKIPYMGRTLSAMTLTPQTGSIKGAELTYKFKAPAGKKDVKVLVVVKSTLDYLNKGGLTYSVAIDGGKAATVNFNEKLNEDPANVYTLFYPTVASRVVEKTIPLTLGTATDGTHTLTFVPNDPGIVLEKIVVDFGGYTKQYLHGEESIRK